MLQRLSTKFNIIRTFYQSKQVGPQLLGRWDTKVDETVKQRRIDLANIDSCGDEACSNPQKLITLYASSYYNPKIKL